ncbi:hypothetical protein BO86DRAFT_162263 [Aspergillus japonicus CBS 114.51]|uniref:Uncharacterized protein n=1 Tax=Aspergillus japonicus CBS 114.51 TaxID=1448312 RepID=A0A8T8XE55_ASPJA|nr:hypothetical protein BO86DRAFT_162263 [Aspergillus japonicus CBS 114.51]RAH85639.1 hypothetical protein BO86DRAFT_162263 [Aspergillus japonicus CBS 114.51]
MVVRYCTERRGEVKRTERNLLFSLSLSLSPSYCFISQGTDSCELVFPVGRENKGCSMCVRACVHSARVCVCVCVFGWLFFFFAFFLGGMAGRQAVTCLRDCSVLFCSVLLFCLPLIWLHVATLEVV